jgi:hypothetical protein
VFSFEQLFWKSSQQTIRENYLIKYNTNFLIVYFFLLENLFNSSIDKNKKCIEKFKENGDLKSNPQDMMMTIIRRVIEILSYASHCLSIN